MDQSTTAGDPTTRLTDEDTNASGVSRPIGVVDLPSRFLQETILKCDALDALVRELKVANEIGVQRVQAELTKNATAWAFVDLFAKWIDSRNADADQMKERVESLFGEFETLLRRKPSVTQIPHT